MIPSMESSHNYAVVIIINSLIECNYDNAQGIKTWMLNFNSFEC